MAKRLATKIAGWSFIFLGAIGLFLPFLQGILFLLIGLTILSTEYLWAQRMLERLKARFPTLARRATEISTSVTDWFRRIRLKRSEKP